MKILTVDDDKTTRFLIRKILAHEFSAEVVEAEDAFSALDILGAKPPPDLAILDMMMPRMDGIQLLENIRKNYGLRRMKVIMCSAQNERIRIAQAYALEIQDYIIKPVQTQKLSKAVRLALRLTDDSVPAKPAPLPQSQPETDLKTYMRQLTAMASQTTAFIRRIESSAATGDRASAAILLKAIAQAASGLGINKLAGTAEKLESQVLYCTEESLAGGIELLKDEQDKLNKTVAVSARQTPPTTGVSLIASERLG